MRKNRPTLFVFSGFFVLVLAGLIAGTAWAETVELVTYYPAPGQGGDLHVNSLTVGADYNGTTPTDGTAIISDRLGIGTTAPVGELEVVSTNNSDPTRGITSTQINSGIQAALVNARKARGTPSSLNAVASGDYGGAFLSFNYDGSSYLATAGFGTRVNGTVSEGSVPTDLFFYTSGGANNTDPYSNSHVRLVIDKNGNVGIGTVAPSSVLHVASTAANTENDILLDYAGNDAAVASEFRTRRSRGTLAAPTAVQVGDDLGGVIFQGWNGTGYTHGAGIDVIVEQAPVAGQPIQAALDFYTQDVRHMRINATGNVGIGTAAPANRLHVVGTVRIVDGTQANGRVLTSDANGVASWQTVTATATLSTTNCKLGVRASRTSTPQCGPGFYLKALVKSTNNNWDGYGSICCALDASAGTSFNDVVDDCNANKSKYGVTGGANLVTCPAKD